MRVVKVSYLQMKGRWDGSYVLIVIQTAGLIKKGIFMAANCCECNIVLSLEEIEFAYEVCLDCYLRVSARLNSQFSILNLISENYICLN